ncbi:MAG: hypothetical protein KC912_20845 [Proteobacteria bacterium]|nr:hypothetical protein [Pseudomonadota bacterium]
MQRLLPVLLLLACNNDVAITEQENVAPQAVIQFPDDLGEFDENDTIEFRGLVTDDNGLADISSVTWTSSLDGPISELAVENLASDGTTVQASTLSEGTHTITLDVADAGGLLGSDSITVLIDAAAQLPIVEIIDPANLTEVPVDVQVDLTGAADDPNQTSDTLTIRWTVAPANGSTAPVDLVWTGPGATGVTTADWTPDTVGNYVIRLEATDDDANTVNDEIALLVADPGNVDGDNDGYSPNQGDCDDGNPNVSPGADEACNNVDDDCNQIVDDKDLDNDAHVDDACTDYAGNLPVDDCDDGNTNIYGGAPELSDNLDNDCDGGVDDGTDTWDADGDCACPSTTLACTGSTNPQCGALEGGDCADDDPGRFPSNSETTCDSIDNDCNSATEDAPDGDNDGSTVCDDCDDNNPNNFPGNVESCDGVTNDCDIAVDEDITNQDFYPDVDGDLFGDPNGTPVNACEAPANHVPNNTDCDDNSTNGELRNPGLTEVTCDGIDNDCDSTTTDTPNVDGDAVGLCDGDCDDDNAANYPGNTEICDGIDNNCNTQADENLTFLDYWPDTDGDGAGNEDVTADNRCDAPTTGVWVTNDNDCDDGDRDNFGGNSETCDNADNDCDGAPDNGLTFEDWYVDSDGDSYGNGATSPVNACANPSTGVTDRWASNGDDCDDNSNLAHPGITVETTCDGLDNDCEVTTLDEPDGDNDGSSVCDDCDDDDINNFPGNNEECDGEDNNCDGQPDDGLTFTTYYQDFDGDGYGNAAVSSSECAALSGWVASNNDCDDDEFTMNPGYVEVCDGLNNDCDASGVDEQCPTGITVDAGNVTGSPAYGGGGGSPFADGCANNQVMVGIHIRAANLTDSVQAICAGVSLVTDTASVPYGYSIDRSSTNNYLTEHGGNGGTEYTWTCPGEQVVMGIFGRAGGEVDSLQLKCGTLSVNGSTPGGYTTLRTTGTSSPQWSDDSGGSAFGYDCPDNRAVNWLWGRGASRIDQIGVSCAAIVIDQ